MEMCARCKKRVAVVFVSRIENGETINEGICLKCARELGIKPVNDIIEKMGISEEELDQMDSEMDNMLSMVESEDIDEDSADESQEGRAPAFDIRKLFGAFPVSNNAPKNKDEKSDSKSSKKDKNSKNSKFLSQYCVDLNNKARNGKIDKVIGRADELARVIQILSRRQKNNPCLIGEPGVGKTAIAEALALKIVAGDVPFKLKDKELHMLDLTALVAGTQFRGQFEQRMKGLIDEVKARGNVILVIDEVHSIAGAGDAEGSMNAANILKPALSRGDIQVIGATTLKEYRKYIEKDSALERRFQPVVVEESSIDDTVEILKGIKGYYEEFHGIKIPNEILRKTVVLSERYISDRFLPDKAIDLLDEAAAYLVLNTPIIHEFFEVKKQLDELNAEKEELENKESKSEEEASEKYKRLADIKVSEINLQPKFDQLKEECTKIKLSANDLANVIEKWTGVPASKINTLEYERLLGLEKRLKNKIVGQDEAVDSIVRAIKRSRAGISLKKKPVSFIFAGPTGVGKTELVKTLASDLFDSPETIIRFDMSEFMEKHSVSRIIGAPPGYVGFDEAGQLTEKIRRKPYSVVLFDEIEKAHPDVLNIMLQILDDGILTDAQGRKINFENTVIVMTTNAGSDINLNTAGFSSTGADKSVERTEKALESFLRPEFINRVDEVVVFRKLNEDDFSAIAVIMLNELREIMEEKGIDFCYTDKAVSYVSSESFSSKYGARNMRRFIQKNIEDEIANMIIEKYDEDISSITVDLDEQKNKLVFECR
ncbi:MAG: ATP-dependent Clp protease ATP-binding subunit [Ruminococcaceae bacterium]|nr:ATP-dependent Clp protease ATP-binding subunit [Oscillospiraceae bacterium]